jgi:uncharacterized protein (DUF1778 family)
MAIAKNPRRDTSDRKAEDFIAAAAEEDRANGGSRKPVILRVPVDLISRIDRAARRLGLTRSGFIVMSAAERLQRMEEQRSLK